MAHLRRRTPVLVVATSGALAARVEAVVRSDPTLHVAVSDLADLTDRLDDHDPAIVIVAAPPQRVARALESLRGRPRVRALVVLTPEPREAWTANARRAGVRAVLRDDASPEALSAALAAIRVGLVVLHPDSMGRTAAAPAASAAGEASRLTPREVEILEMMAEGLSNRLIATRLAISRHTVKFHVASILAKLAAASRTEAVTLGVRQGLIAL